MQRQRKRQIKQKDAYTLGKTCFFKGAMDNPFKAGSYFYKEWQRGFDRAYIDNLSTLQ